MKSVRDKFYKFTTSQLDWAMRIRWPHLGVLRTAVHEDFVPAIVEEIEAWFVSDNACLQIGFRGRAIESTKLTDLFFGVNLDLYSIALSLSKSSQSCSGFFVKLERDSTTSAATARNYDLFCFRLQ